MFFENLKQSYDKLSTNEQEVIDYLMRQENIETVTLKTIREDIFISSSTVIRACKKMGYHTYNDLRYDLRLSKELEQQSKLHPSTSFDEMKEQMTVEFQRTLSLLKQEDFDLFADKLIEARRIFCVGVGSSYMAISDFNRKLKLVDIWSNDYFEQYSIERISDISTNEDVMIVFSLGGNTKFVNQSILKAKQNGTQILAITTLNKSPLVSMSDHVIYVYDAPKRREKIRSRLMFNLVSTLLFETLITRLNQNKKRTPIF